jgi:hypothetical protein
MKDLQMKTSPQERALDWQLNPPREHSCSICGACGPTLTVGDTDVMHTRFAARCHHHIESSPRLRKYYAMIQSVVGMNEDQLWFSQNPGRTTRYRLSRADEKVEGMPMLVRIRPDGFCGRVMIMGQVVDKDASDHVLAQVYDRYHKIASAKKGGAA